MSEAASSPLLFGPLPAGFRDSDAVFVQQPAGPPPTPRHTGIKAMAAHLVTNFKYLPSKENLLWAGAGGGLALVAHPFDDDVNQALVGNDTAENFFKAGAVLGQLGTLLGSASVVYAVGRIKGAPKVSHLGMDLIEALAMSEATTETLKYTTRRERPMAAARLPFRPGTPPTRLRSRRHSSGIRIGASRCPRTSSPRTSPSHVCRPIGTG